jgi:membrane protease YdiL (CAAX protease family)
VTTHAIPPDNTAGQVRLLSRMGHWAAIRILVHAIVLIVVVVTTGIVSRLLIPPLPSPLHHPLQMLVNLLSVAALLVSYALTVRLLERRSATEINLRRGAPLLLIGTIIGTALMGAVYFIAWRLGLAAFARGTGLDGLSGALVAMFAAAVLEELLFRAVLFRIVEDATGTMAAVLVSAIAFGLIHGVNSGATPVSTVAIALEAGVLLALAYAMTRNLWLPIGIHTSWNFAEGSLFGAKVSGYAMPRSLFHSTLSGPPLLTGGAFGPEASVIAIGVCLVAAAVMAIVIVRKGGWRKRTYQPVLS